MAKSPQSEKIIYLGQIQFVYRTQSFTRPGTKDGVLNNRFGAFIQGNL